MAERGGISAREFVIIAACLLVAVGAALYGWGWSLDTHYQPGSTFNRTAAELRVDAAMIRDRTANLVLRGNLLWWGDRALILGVLLGAAALLSRRRS